MSLQLVETQKKTCILHPVLMGQILDLVNLTLRTHS